GHVRRNRANGDQLGRVRQAGVLADRRRPLALPQRRRDVAARGQLSASPTRRLSRRAVSGPAGPGARSIPGFAPAPQLARKDWPRKDWPRKTGRRLAGLGDLAGTDTGSADRQAPRAPSDDGAHPLDIRVPAPLRTPVRVADAHAYRGPPTANLTNR